MVDKTHETSTPPLAGHAHRPVWQAAAGQAVELPLALAEKGRQWRGGGGVQSAGGDV